MAATNGVNGVAKSEALAWKLGLVNHHNKYLTAETFGFKINASATTMKKKQLWTIEHDPSEEEVIYIKSHLGRYLAGDKKGNVTCGSEERGDMEKFTIVYHQDGSGRWAFQSKGTTYFFGGADDNLQCYEKGPGDCEWWTPQLAVHPQVNLKSVHRKKYAHLSESGEIHVNELIPWGQDALITLEYRDGKYGIKTCDNRYLERTGTLVNQPGKDSLYTLEIKSGQYSGMTFKDTIGKYLTAVGLNGTMQSKDKSAKQDIVFGLEDSHPQAFITAHNGKKVSTKQGIDLSANQDEVTDSETFQIEWDKKASQWRIRTCENKYWSLEQASGIQSVGDCCVGRGNLRGGGQGKPKGLFQFEWLEDGRVAIKANNGRYLTAKLNGALYAISDNADAKEIFTITIMNRPLLVLRCEYGFIGFKSTTNPRIECNKSTYDQIHLEHGDGEHALYYLKGMNGRYWSLDDTSNVNADSAEQKGFIFELFEQSKVKIKAPNGMYLKGEQNGIVSATTDQSTATLWEY